LKQIGGDLLTIGRIVKPQGRKGEVLVESFSDRPERFPTLREVWLTRADGSTRLALVSGCWPHKGRFVLKLEGVDSISAAEELRGQSLALHESTVAPLPEGVFYHHQLVGLEVQTESGRALGSVADLIETGAALVLVVRGPEGERLIPLAEPFIRRVDLAAKLLVVSLPETVDAL
jgi:16S rRNA processing protein RimM